MRGIGGFFPLQLPEKKTSGNVLSLWNIPAQSHLFFSNARSALHHLLMLKAPKTLWLPAYSCVALTQGVANLVPIRFFPLSPSLSPDCAYLRKHVKQGDAILAIDYFGRNPDKEFLRFVAATSQVTFIEDRAQALYPSRATWGDFILYSPRKLLGVADGGILVSLKHALPPLEQPPIDTADFIAPSLLRYEDAGENNSAQWYAAFKANENAMIVSNAPMSRLSHAILAMTDPKPLIKKRRTNYELLMKGLKDITFMPAKNCDFAPFGYPIRVENRKKTAEALHAQGIYAAHHWPELPSDPKEFPAEHRLADQLLTLPVDQRYDSNDMKRIIAVVRNALS